MLAQAFLTVLRAQSAWLAPEPVEPQEKKREPRPQLPPSKSSLWQFKRQRGLTCL